MRGIPCIPHPLPPAVLAVLGVLAACTPASAADGPGAEPDSVFAAVRAAAARGHVEKTQQQGFDIARGTFRDLPRQGGLLIGFDVGLGRFVDREVVYALRPLYLTADGEIPTERYGLFVDRNLPNQTIKTKVSHQVRVKAKPGYAVGGVTIRTGLAIDGMSLTFIRIAGQALDSRDVYVSEWVGNSSGGREATLGGGGNLIVGVFGCQDEHDVRALGLLYVAGTAPAGAGPVPPSPKAPRQPMEVAGPAAAPPLGDEPPPLAPAAPEAPSEKSEHQPAKQQTEFNAALIWLPFTAFGAVFVVFAAALVMFSSRKEKHAVKAAPQKKGAAAVVRRPRQPEPSEEEIPVAVALPDEGQITAAPPAAPLPPPELPRLEAPKLKCPPITQAEIDNQATGGMALASLVLGVVSLVVCCIPILGLPVSITGFILGMKGQTSLQQNKAVIGICLNALGFAVAVVNGLMWLRFFILSAQFGMH
jgi:hypothetical protein